eukprot:30817-Pelagococcus_subviridis.AAC.2
MKSLRNGVHHADAVVWGPHTSVTRWDVRTFPPTTAAPSFGDRNVPSGTTIAPDAVNHRRRRHRGRRVPVPAHLVGGPGEVEHRAAVARVERQRQLHDASVVHLVLRGERHAVFGVGRVRRGRTLAL